MTIDIKSRKITLTTNISQAESILRVISVVPSFVCVPTVSKMLKAIPHFRKAHVFLLI